MGQKIGVAVVHGIGHQDESFAAPAFKAIADRFEDATGTAAESALVMEPVVWSPILQREEDMLWERLDVDDLRYRDLRKLMIDLMGDGIAYQQGPHNRQIYDAVHTEFAKTLKKIALRAGGKAPLCIIAHSLGCVITSNYIYDLQNAARKRGLIGKTAREQMGRRPLERGETLALLYTLGSPLAVWSLPYPDFGSPIHHPAPQLEKHWPGLEGEWLNFYDKDDVLAYPLATLNASYAAVVHDQPVNIGNLLQSWNPLSHLSYWTDEEVVERIVKGLIACWRVIGAS